MSWYTDWQKVESIVDFLQGFSKQTLTEILSGLYADKKNKPYDATLNQIITEVRLLHLYATDKIGQN